MKKFLLLTVLIAVAYPPLTTSEVISSQLDATTPKAEKKNTALYQRILEKNASFSDVIHSLSIDDKQALSNNINALKRYSTDMRVVGLLKDIWNGDVSGHPGLAWKSLRSPSAKVSIAFVLHDADSVNARIYMEYIKKQLQSGDVEAESNAAMSLA